MFLEAWISLFSCYSFLAVVIKPRDCRPRPLSTWLSCHWVKSLSKLELWLQVLHSTYWGRTCLLLWFPSSTWGTYYEAVLTGEASPVKHTPQIGQYAAPNLLLGTDFLPRVVLPQIPTYTVTWLCWSCSIDYSGCHNICPQFIPPLNASYINVLALLSGVFLRLNDKQ